MIDAQVMGKKKKAAMGLPNKSMADAIIHDAPALNLVYIPEKFQKYRKSFGPDYTFLVPAQELGESDITIPYHQMRRPIIYISLGSLISNRGFCKECIRAFGGKNLSAILNTGRIDPATLGDIPQNIYAYSFVPQIEVLEHADVFLTHYGMNSVNEAMCADVPMVAMGKRFYAHISQRQHTAVRFLYISHQGVGPESGRRYTGFSQICGSLLDHGQHPGGIAGQADEPYPVQLCQHPGDFGGNEPGVQSYLSNPFHHSTVSPCRLCQADSRMSARLGKPLCPSTATIPIRKFASPPCTIKIRGLRLLLQAP